MMEPITRKEMFMDAAAKGDTTGLPVPVTREEMYLYIKASGDTTGILEPITRREIFWHAMCIGDATGLPDPATREEIFLHAAATGETEGLPEPVTRTEIYLKAIAEAGGGGGGGDDDGGAKPFDELTWDQVIASTKTGKYKTFSVGDMKELDLGSEGIVHMQIVGIDADDLADGSGKAPLTFISKELLKTSHRMNPELIPSAAPYDEGTGSIGGWEKSEMRSYLKTTIKPLIPENVRNAIVNVTKYSKTFDMSGTAVNNVVTTDDVWIPSIRETGGTFQGTETTGAMYSVFADNNSRIKKENGSDTSGAWFTRSASRVNEWYRVNVAGKIGTAVQSQLEQAIALGFCL